MILWGKKVILKNLMGTISKSFLKDVSYVFLTTFGRLQNYTVLTLEDCYMCKAWEKLLRRLVG